VKAIALIPGCSVLALVTGLGFLPAHGQNAPAAPAPTPANAALAHVRNEFAFTVRAPYAKAAPLFGADAERAWAGDWNPKFLYPASPPLDVPGAVFEVKHGGHHATWVCTSFDLKTGHVQYVYVVGGALATLIDIHLTARDASSTLVEVAYERTALTPEANDHVRQMGESDRDSGREWQEQIDAYLKTASRD
jgi:hypothetical protein